MAITESWFKQDLKEPVKRRYIIGNFFSLDNVGNLVGVKVYDNGAEATLSGSVTGYCALADGTTVPVAGTRSGNQAYILLPQSALSIPGYIGIVLKLTDGNTITTLLSIIATVYQSQTDTVITPSQQIITDWANQIAAALQEVEDASAAQDEKIDSLKSAIDYTKGQTRNVFTAFGAVPGLVNASGAVVGTTGTTSDYLSVEPNTTYLSTLNNGPYSLQVVAFYTTKAQSGFISRLVRGNNTITWKFTTPANCNYIRVCIVGSSFEASRSITVNQELLPYVPSDKLININCDSDEKVIDLQMKVNGINSIVDEITLGAVIGANGLWGDAGGEGELSHILIPIEENDSIEIIASEYNTVVALLKSARYGVAEAPDFVYKYDLIENDVGEQWWEIKTDGQGNPILDERKVVTANSKLNIKASPESKYLYITKSYKIGNEIINALPAKLVINDFDLTKTHDAKPVEYTTVFFDDFDTIDRNVWSFHTQAKPVAGESKSVYKSRFLTDDDNIRAEQSMLVMKVEKRSGDNGEWTDGTNVYPIEYVAPYISTCDSFVIPNGRISARLKTSKPSGKDFFSWCFWTFGQNAPWGYAHEMDIIEVIQHVFSESVVSQTGVTIPAGSVRTALSAHLHVKNQQGVDVEKTTHKEIDVALKNGSTLGNDEVFYLNGVKISTDEWHVYSVEWDNENVSMLIDGEVLCTYNAADIGAYDENGNIGFKHPQDIRFNIKCRAEMALPSEGYLFVDWVRAETLNKTPCISISNGNISMSVDESRYIEPNFNESCTNYAFDMETNDTGVVQIIKYLDDASQMVVHRIKALAQGIATVNILSANGVVSSSFTVTVS